MQISYKDNFNRDFLLANRIYFCINFFDLIMSLLFLNKKQKILDLEQHENNRDSFKQKRNVFLLKNERDAINENHIFKFLNQFPLLSRSKSFEKNLSVRKVYFFSNMHQYCVQLIPIINTSHGVLLT